MTNCTCGKPVRLGAMRTRFNGKHGVAHYIEHMDGSSVKPCVDGDWACSMNKPYAKYQKDWPCTQMVERWESKVSAAM